MARAAAIVHSPGYHCDIGVHVFPMEKFGLLRRRLVTEGHVADADVLEPAPASRADLARVHGAEYLDDLEGLRWTRRTKSSELPLTAGIVRAYRLAAGGTTLAARESLARGFGVNLGGGFHHAHADHAEGFCYLNDIAVAVRALQHEGAVRRVAVVDCDVHQGNGTASLFRGDETVFTFSIHQEYNYPTPKEPGDLDVGLEDGTGDDEYLAALGDALERVWGTEPELVVYLAGADAYREDQLGGLGLTMAGLEARDGMVLRGCARRGVPAVVTLGGGYARRLEDTVAIHFATCRLAIELAHGGRPGGDTA
jgi:acetoin utilization deacetylase AcuC-like enzyme